MDPEQIIGQLIGGFLGGKKSRKHGGFSVSALGLGGGRGHGSRQTGGGLLNAGTLLTVGGLIWGALETMQQGSAGAGQTPPPATPPPAAPRGVLAADTPPLVVPPPLPPIPGATPATAAAAPPTPVPPALLPLVQLAISAARADGELSTDEVAVIRVRAGELGAAALVETELEARRPLEAIVPAFTTPEQRQVAYALAYAVVHGEGDISPGERMYLTQLERLLRLDHQDVERIERETLAGDQR
jgi:uncharacterized membrane protein YebE (DUF533 family)